MKLVCDTNVLISGILFGGNSRQILQLASRGTITNFISPAILYETENVLLRPKFGLKPEQIINIMTLIRDTFEIIVPSRKVSTIKSDPDDNRILEAASAASVECIISGDKHLLELKEWEDIRILSPREFMMEKMGE